MISPAELITENSPARMKSPRMKHLIESTVLFLLFIIPKPHFILM